MCSLLSGMSKPPQRAVRQVQLKLPQGIQVSPGSYRLSAEELQKLMQNLRQVPSGAQSGVSSALSASVVQAVQGSITLLSATMPLSQSNDTARQIPSADPAADLQNKLQSSGPPNDAPTEVQGGATGGSESIEMAPGEQTENTQSTTSAQSAAKDPQPSTSTEGADEMATVDDVVVLQGTKRKSSTPTTALPKRTQLFSLNPLCIPVRCLQPVKKEKSSD